MAVARVVESLSRVWVPSVATPWREWRSPTRVLAFDLLSFV
jgi:hypothetical protein